MTWERSPEDPPKSRQNTPSKSPRHNPHIDFEESLQFSHTNFSPVIGGSAHQKSPHKTHQKFSAIFPHSQQISKRKLTTQKYNIINITHKINILLIL